MAETRTATPPVEDGRVRIHDSLFLVEVDISDLQEQDVNARVMSQREFERLVANIKKRGQLESLPYCCQPNGSGPIQVVSGHHRLRAATAAGFKRAWVMLDTSPLTRSEIVAKQLAHNAIVGEDDPSIVKTLLGFIDNPDDLLATGLDEKLFRDANEDLQLFAPHVDFEQRTVTFAFLPHQVGEIEKLVEKLAEKPQDMVVTGDQDQFEQFLRVAGKFARLRKILAGQTAVANMVRLALAEVDEWESDQ